MVGLFGFCSCCLFVLAAAFWLVGRHLRYRFTLFSCVRMDNLNQWIDDRQSFERARHPQKKKMQFCSTRNHSRFLDRRPCSAYGIRATNSFQHSLIFCLFTFVTEQPPFLGKLWSNRSIYDDLQSAARAFKFCIVSITEDCYVFPLLLCSL